jgi:hypothetical protein
MSMADKPQAPQPAVEPSKRLIDRDVVQLEFLIDDLIKQLVPDRLSPVAACNGCKGCKGALDLPTDLPTRGR